MSLSISRFVLTDEGTIIDTARRLPLSPVSPCGCRPENPETELNKQIYLRRCVLRAQLSAIAEKIEPEAYSLAQVIYWTVYVSQLDWTIGQTVARFPDTASRQSPHGLHDLSHISILIDDVSMLVRDLYADRDQHILGDLLEAIGEIALLWNRARTAPSRAFFERLSEQINVPIHPLGSIVLVPDGLTPASRSDGSNG